MNKELFTFRLNNYTKFIIQFKYLTEKIDIDDQAKFIFQYYNHKKLLSYDFLKFQIDDLKKCLILAQKNILQIDTHFTKDIGYYWNYYCSKYSYPKLYFDIMPDYSILTDRIIFNSAFIYNDEYGNIILNITSNYPHRYSHGKRKPSYRYFLKWMKTYKPIFKQIISPETALQWIDQADTILQEIEKNTEI